MTKLRVASSMVLAVLAWMSAGDVRAQTETYIGTGANESSGNSWRLTIKKTGDDLAFEMGRTTCEATKLTPQKTFTTYCSGPKMPRRKLSGDLNAAALERAGSAGGVSFTIKKR